MANEKFNGQNNGQQPQVRVENAPKMSKKFLNMTGKQWLVTSLCTVGGGALIFGGVKLVRYLKAKKAAAAQEPAAPAAEDPKK